MTDLLTASDVARILKIDRSSAYDLMASGALPVIRPTVGGKSVRVHPADLEAWIDGQRAEQRRRIEAETLVTDIRRAGERRRGGG